MNPEPPEPPEPPERPRRVAYVRVHQLPLAALVRHDPSLGAQPVAVVDAPQELRGGRGAMGAAVVRWCTRAARGLGVRPGQTGHQARTVAPDVQLRGIAGEAVEAARGALLDALSSVTPRMEPDDEGVWAEVTDLGRIYGTDTAIAQALGQAARSVGLRVAVAVAGSRGVARIAARRRVGVTVVPTGDEAGFLAPLPLEVLPLSDVLRGDLLRLGITRLGALAALPSAATGLRLGEDAARAVRLAQGEDDTPLVTRPMPLRFEESMAFDWEVDQVAPVLFAVRRLLEALVARLACRAAAIGGMVLGLHLVNRTVDERRVDVAAPTRDVPSLVKLVWASLEAHPAVDRVVGVRLLALPGGLRPMQLGLFDPPGPPPDKLALTLTRLVALVGDARVGSPVVPDSHRPHAVALATFDPPRGVPAAAAAVHAFAGALALHVFRPPRPAEVSLAGERIVRVRTAGEGAVDGRVVALGGPWRATGAWWGDAFDHEGWDVELDDGGLYLVAYDRTRGVWQLDGVYE